MRDKHQAQNGGDKAPVVSRAQSRKPANRPPNVDMMALEKTPLRSRPARLDSVEGKRRHFETRQDVKQGPVMLCQRDEAGRGEDGLGSAKDMWALVILWKFIVRTSEMVIGCLERWNV